MSASANVFTIAKVEPKTVAREVYQSTTIYTGVLVCLNATGYLVEAADAANLRFDGYAEVGADNSSGSSGDVSALVAPPAALGLIEVDAVSPDRTWIGYQLAIVDYKTVALPGTTSYSVRCGKCVAVTKTGTSGRVVIDTRMAENTGSTPDS